MKRRPWWLLAVALVVGGGSTSAYWLLARAAPAPAFRLAAVEPGPVVSAVTASGTLSAVVTVEVGSQLSGQIARIYADFNDTVTSGQLLARIDTRLLEARILQAEADLTAAGATLEVERARRQRAGADVATARATLASNDAQVQGAEVAVRETKRDLARRQSLQARGVAAVADLDKAESAARTADSELASARARRQAAAAELDAAEAALLVAGAQVDVAAAQVKQREAAVRQVQVDIDRSSIRSPIDGVVVQRAVNLGQTVAASLQAPTVFTIAQDLSRMQVLANVDEADIGRVTVGLPVTFTVSAYPRDEFRGRVAQLRLAPQSNQNVVTYVVVIEVDNAGRRLLPGMTANVRIIADHRDDVLRVPNMALRFRPMGVPAAATAPTGTPAGDGGQVWVLGADGAPKAVPVSLGASDGSFTEVAEGTLVAGQQVITGVAPADAEGPRRPPRLGF